VPGVPLVLIANVNAAVESYSTTLGAIKFAIRTKYQADASERVRSRRAFAYPI
jgi:hypothetical protein